MTPRTKRLFEIEVFRRATTGHLAEILGSSYIPMDLSVRRDFYTGAELSHMFGALPAAFHMPGRSLVVTTGSGGSPYTSGSSSSRKKAPIPPTPSSGSAP